MSIVEEAVADRVGHGWVAFVLVSSFTVNASDSQPSRLATLQRKAIKCDRVKWTHTPEGFASAQRADAAAWRTNRTTTCLADGLSELSLRLLQRRCALLAGRIGAGSRIGVGSGGVVGRP